MKFPNHKYGMLINHNEHKLYGRTVKQFFEDAAADKSEFESMEKKQECIDKNEIWMMQLYQNSPQVSRTIYAPSFEELIKFSGGL